MSGNGLFFLPSAEGACPEIILVEGLFDLAVLWQAGFPNVTCSMGIYLKAIFTNPSFAFTINAA